MRNSSSESGHAAFASSYCCIMGLVAMEAHASKTLRGRQRPTIAMSEAAQMRRRNNHPLSQCLLDVMHDCRVRHAHFGDTPHVRLLHRVGKAPQEAHGMLPG